MHDGHRPVLAHVRVGITFRWFAMGGPTGVTDTGHCATAVAGDLGVQVVELARRSGALDIAPLEDGDAS